MHAKNENNNNNNNVIIIIRQITHKTQIGKQNKIKKFNSKIERKK